MNFKKFINKNKNIIVAVLILIAIITAIFIVKKTVMFDESKAIYGDRTDGIKKVLVTDEQKSAIKTSLNDQAKSVEVNVEGRIINILIETKPEIDLGAAKAMGDKALEVFTDEQKSYYDIEALIDNPSNTSQFPIIGYKHKTKGAYTWTRDREKTEG